MSNINISNKHNYNMISLDQMRDFVKVNFGEEYASNDELVKKIYAKHYEPKTVADAVTAPAGTQCELKLLVVEKVRETEVQICSSCNKRKCDCGLEQFEVRKIRAYVAGDGTGVIDIQQPFWIEEELKEEAVYKIKGKVNVWNDKAEIILSSCELVKEANATDDAVGDKLGQDAITGISSALKIVKGVIDKALLEDLCKRYNVSLDVVVRHFNLREKDGMYAQ